LALDADYLARGGASVRYAHDFAAGRRVRTGRPRCVVCMPWRVPLP
jgi:hypothetical protein